MLPHGVPTLPGCLQKPVRALAIRFFPQARRAQKRGTPQGHARPRHVGPHGENRRRVSGGGPPRGIEPLSGDPQSPILTTIRRGPPVRVPTAPLASPGCAGAVYARARERPGIPIDILPPRPRASARAGRHTEPPRGAAVAGLLEPPYRPPHSLLATVAPYPALDRPEQPGNPCVSCAPSLRSYPYNDNGKQHNVTSAHINHDFSPGGQVLLRVHGSKGQAVSSMNMPAARSSHFAWS